MKSPGKEDIMLAIEFNPSVLLLHGIILLLCRATKLGHCCPKFDEHICEFFSPHFMSHNPFCFFGKIKLH